MKHRGEWKQLNEKLNNPYSLKRNKIKKNSTKMIICYIIIFIYDLINLQGNGGKKINNSIISHFNHWVIYIIYRGRKKGKKIFDEN